MNIDNKIPFGLSESKNEFVDVHDVPNGIKCLCICPSCRLQLIARQGDFNRWHFAHSGKKNKKIDKECEYSFYVSVRSMAKQIVKSGLSISTPEQFENLRMLAPRIGSPSFSDEVEFIKVYQITKKGVITLESVKKEYVFEGVTVDIIGEFKHYPIVIYFSHPNRQPPDSLRLPDNKMCGVIEIDLRETLKIFTNKQSKEKRFLDELEYFITSNTDSKKWLYHPRKESVEKEARIKLTEEIKNNVALRTYTYNEENYGKLLMSKRQENITDNHDKSFICLACKSDLMGVAASSNKIITCPKCNTHLYVTTKPNIIN